MSNRMGIGVFGGLLVGAGLFTLWASKEAPGVEVVDQQWFVDYPWGRFAAGVVVMLTAFAATRWLLSAAGLGRLARRDGTGTAMLGVVVKGFDGIEKTQVKIIDRERMLLRVDSRPWTPLEELVARLDGPAISRVRGVVGGGDADPRLPALVRLHVTRR